MSLHVNVLTLQAVNSIRVLVIPSGPMALYSTDTGRQHFSRVLYKQARGRLLFSVVQRNDQIVELVLFAQYILDSPGLAKNQ